MFRIKRVKIRFFETGFYFKDGGFCALLDKGSHWFVGPLNRVGGDILSRCKAWIDHDDLDMIIHSVEDDASKHSFGTECQMKKNTKEEKE